MSVNGNPPDTVCHCAAIRQAARRVTRFYDRAMAPAGLRVTQFSLLAALLGAGAATIGELAKRLAMDRATLGHNLRPLEAAGFVAMTAGEDRRSRIVTLTDAGRRAFDAARPVWRAAQKTFETAVGRDEAVSLRATMNRLARTPFAAKAEA